MRLFIVFVLCLVWVQPAQARLTEAELQVADAACVQGDVGACDSAFIAAGHYSGTTDPVSGKFSTPFDLGVLVDRLTAECASDRMLSCTDRAAALFWYGQNGDPTIYTAFSEGCVSGDGWACVLLGKLRLTQPLPPEFGLDALHNAKRRECGATGDPASCVDYAYLNAAVGGVERDPNILVDGLVRACDADERRACAQLSFYFGNQDQAEKIRTLLPDFAVDYALATNYGRKACDLGNPVGCWNVAMAYGKGAGVIPNRSTTGEYRGRACALGMPEACGQRSGLQKYAFLIRIIVVAVIGLVSSFLFRLIKGEIYHRTKPMIMGSAAPGLLFTLTVAFAFWAAGFVMLSGTIRPATDTTFWIGLGFIGLGVMVITSLLPAYDIAWDREGIRGPWVWWAHPFSQKKRFIAWNDITKVKHASYGGIYVTDNAGHKIMWNFSYTGSVALERTLEWRRPDLFE